MIYSTMSYSVELLQSALDFIDGLPNKMRAKAYRSVSLLREFGPYLKGTAFQANSRMERPPGVESKVCF